MIIGEMKSKVFQDLCDQREPTCGNRVQKPSLECVSQL